jgi:uncharacterized protein (TIGR02118 family)
VVGRSALHSSARAREARLSHLWEPTAGPSPGRLPCRGSLVPSAGVFTAVSTWSFPRPGEEEAFEEHYWSVHVPLAQRIPRTAELVLTRTAYALPGEQPAFYRAVVMSFPSQEAFEAATRTPEWEALRGDSASMIERFGVRLLTGMGEPQAIDVAG